MRGELDVLSGNPFVLTLSFVVVSTVDTFVSVYLYILSAFSSSAFFPEHDVAIIETAVNKITRTFFIRIIFVQ